MDMFCFQCEQTAFGKGCTKRGVCGKLPETANAQDRLLNAAVELALHADASNETTDLIVDALFTTITNVNFDTRVIEKFAEKLGARHASHFDISDVWNSPEDVRSLKSTILFGLKGMAAYAHHARVLGFRDAEVDAFFRKGLRIVTEETDAEKLLAAVLETGRANLKCMELLDKANTSTYGTPQPVKVSTNIEKGPFIIVTGHDLRDLHLLLEQTKGEGVNVYTHGEMLPCHAYPELKKYKHLKGNFGTAWQNQQREFDGVPAAIVWTTNCIMPVKDSYKDRVFTTSVVDFPDTAHIGEDKNFSPAIKKAKELGGYARDTEMAGINGGHVLTTGFGHTAILSAADKIKRAVLDGKIGHIFLVGGCDGAKPGRNYYTEFVKKTPKNSLVLTLACGKFRFNDLDLGEIDGIPRLLDMGQCNDAFGAIKVAQTLADAFGCGVNDLPLTLVLSWYEQKAVCVLLSLLALGIKNIRLGPTLPAFLSSNVLKILVEKFSIKPITTPDADLTEIFGAQQ